MQSWAYGVFGNQHAIQFVVMATPDVRINQRFSTVS
jgi:hypothetical protein